MLPYNILSIHNSKASLTQQLPDKYLNPRPHTINPNFLKLSKKQKINDNDPIDEREFNE